MSDLDRNYASPFGRAAGRVDAATVDAGLRAYMLRIYNYMSIGLAITGLAALGVYMAAVTTDQAGAAAKFGNAEPVRRKARGGAGARERVVIPGGGRPAIRGAGPGCARGQVHREIDDPVEPRRMKRLATKQVGRRHCSSV